MNIEQVNDKTQDILNHLSHYGMVLKESEIEFIKTALTEIAQEAVRCGKCVDGDAICGVKKDCHLHDWRNGKQINNP